MELVVILLLMASAFGSSYAKLRDLHRYRDRTTYSREDSCVSPRSSCLLTADCKIPCPPRFQHIEGGNGACYFLSDELNNVKTQTEARDFCEDLGATLLWLEDDNELTELIETFDTATLDYFLNAEYSRDESHWRWENNFKKINWNLVLQNFINPDPAVDNVATVEAAALSSCFVVNLDTLTITAMICTEPNHFICKMGFARDECSDSKQSRCCFSPTYGSYIRDQQIGYNPNLDFGIENCRFKIEEDIIPCEGVLEVIDDPMESLSRIGSSYYYLAQADAECQGREAVISSKEVHQYIMIFLATHELTFVGNAVKFGLTFSLEYGEGIWSNGKPEKYYESYWFPGQPYRNAAVDGGCAGYEIVDGTSVALWSLYPEDECAAFLKFCELPIYTSPIVRQQTRTESCGKRRERGILAKSTYSSYSSNDANFGEFPWQAAIFNHERIGRDVTKVFKCSGALIHSRFVLTSAHCISLKEASDLLVSLGEHNLESKGILEAVSAQVTEIIMHHKYNVRREYKDDIALLQLSQEIELDDYPHIGLGCLPSSHTLHSHTGGWECYAVGWPRQSGYDTRSLRRIPVEFTSEGFCRRINSYYNRYSDYETNRYGSNRYHDLKNEDNYNNPAELLCAHSEGGCLEDSSPVLVCKKKTYIRGPNFSNNAYGRNDKHFPTNEDRHYKNPAVQDLYKRTRITGSQAAYHDSDYSYRSTGQAKKISTSDVKFIRDKKTQYEPTNTAGSSHSYDRPGRTDGSASHPQSTGYSTSRHPYSSLRQNQYRKDGDKEVDYIINSYGDDRFDSDTWYIIGIGNAISRCHESSYEHPRQKYSRYGQQRYQSSSEDYQVYTSVFDYLSFIYHILNLF